MEPFYRNEYRNEMIDEYLENGEEALDGRRLLELILLYTLPIQQAGPMADTLIQHFGTVKDVLHAGAEQLIEVGGIDRETAVLLSLPSSVLRCADVEYAKKTAVLKTPKAVREFAVTFLRGRKNGIFLLSQTDDFHVINTHPLSPGGDTEEMLSRLSEKLKDEGAVSTVILFAKAKETERLTQEEEALVRAVAKAMMKNGLFFNDGVIVTEESAECFSRDFRYVDLIPHGDANLATRLTANAF